MEEKVDSKQGMMPCEILGLLPPIKHKLTTAVQNFPVIPPITAVKTRPSQSQSRDNQSHDDEAGGEGGQDEVREQVKKRNRHLFKVSFVYTSIHNLLMIIHSRFTWSLWPSYWSCF